MGGFRRLGDPFAQNLKRLGGPNRQHGILFGQFASFEAGLLTPNPTGFDSLAGVGANLAVNAGAALRGAFGFQITAVGAGSEAYGVLSGPNGETFFYLEYWFDPNSLTMAGGNDFVIVRAISPGAGGYGYQAALNYNGANYGVLYAVQRDSGVPLVAAATIILDAPQFHQWYWKASSAAGANNGYVKFYINGALAKQNVNIDNDTHNITSVQAGAVLGVDAGTSGPFFMDNIGWSNQPR